MAQYQRWALNILNYIGHGESFARPRNTEQSLIMQAVLEAFRQLSNSCWLITQRLIVTFDLKLGHLTIVPRILSLLVEAMVFGVDAVKVFGEFFDKVSCGFAEGNHCAWP